MLYRTDEQIEHNVGDDEVERAEINDRDVVVSTVSFPISVVAVIEAKRLTTLQREAN